MDYPLLFYIDNETSAFEQICDIYIAWTLYCADDRYSSTVPKVNKYAKRLLGKLLAISDDISVLDKKSVSSIKVYRQEMFNCKNTVDIRCLATIDGIEYQLIIEDKFDNKIDEKQLKTFKQYLSSKFQHKSSTCIFLHSGSIGDEPKDYKLCLKYGFKYFYLWKLKETYFNEGKTGNSLFDEFWFRWSDEEK